MRKIILTSLLLLITTLLLAQRQNVSGQINGPDGRIPNVSVREVDANHRVYNHTTADKNGLFSFYVRDAQHSLQFFAPGYRMFTHKMLGQKSFKVTLEPRRTSPYIGAERLILKSDRLLCGHYMGAEVKQMAWIEQMNDTLFTLILPVKMNMIIDEYPAGRTLLVLSDWDKQLMQWENVVDAYPIDVAPHEVSDVHLAQSYSGTNYQPGGIKDEKPLYAYPHFQLTKANLEYLVQNPQELRRVVVDTYKADNYWNLYPTDQTIDLLKQVLKKTEK
ncbi:MAG: carboxypeptidase regulatory-like domain-containing protein [Bacteroidaceae bacterium]|nr:carboxypeptidase regulatory-like domain-containing protein [Bacteroidaceae bacterium]